MNRLLKILKTLCLIVFLNHIVFGQYNVYPYAPNKYDDEINAKQRKKELEKSREIQRNKSYLLDNPIKAVLIVGPVEENTKDLVFRMQKVESFLRSKHVNVITFYYPNSDWKKIKKLHRMHPYLFIPGMAAEREFYLRNISKILRL